MRSVRVIMSSGLYAITVDLTRPAQNETAALRRNEKFSAPLNDLWNITIVDKTLRSHQEKKSFLKSPSQLSRNHEKFHGYWPIVGSDPGSCSTGKI